MLFCEEFETLSVVKVSQVKVMVKTKGTCVFRLQFQVCYVAVCCYRLFCWICRTCIVSSVRAVGEAVA